MQITITTDPPATLGVALAPYAAAGSPPPPATGRPPVSRAGRPPVPIDGTGRPVVAPATVAPRVEPAYPRLTVSPA